MLVGSGWEGKSFTVSIWNKQGQSIYDVTYPVNVFEPNRLKWVVISIPDIGVTDDFFIHVHTGTSPFHGIHIGTDLSSLNEHSDVTIRKPDGTSNISTQWPWPGGPLGDKSKVNWMIRVNGST
jgi:hypothetical protein